LFLNGQSLGKVKPGKSHENMQCQWMVGYTPGELKAVGYKSGKAAATKVIRTADAPSKIRLSVDGEAMDEVAKDIVQVRVTTTDSKGEFYPYGENRTYFHVIGSGKIRALDNGSPIDVEKHFEATDRIAFFGLTRAYIESTNDDGDIALLASCILGEKKQVTSKAVSIDYQLLQLRGKTAQPKVEVFYTTDGSEPTVQSLVYVHPFEVELGTTVNALVVVDGKPIHTMSERFAKDEGFVWDAKAVAANPGGDQAEDASFNDATVMHEGKGFRGKGYIDFGRNAGGYVEWYQENDGGDGEFTLQIRYSAADLIRSTYRVFTVNGVSKELELRANEKVRSVWQTFEAPVHLGKGANTIRITALEDDGLCIDEIKVK